MWEYACRVPFTKESCTCGCPWEGYDDVEDAQEWRRENYEAALRDKTHPKHKEAWEDLREFLKDNWMSYLDYFLDQAQEYGAEDAENQEPIPHTLREMIGMRLYIDDDDTFECIHCYDATNDSRCYRNRPNHKALKCEATSGDSKEGV
jgi:hypothetical protein